MKIIVIYARKIITLKKEENHLGVQNKLIITNQFLHKLLRNNQKKSKKF